MNEMAVSKNVTQAKFCKPPKKNMCNLHSWTTKTIYWRSGSQHGFVVSWGAAKGLRRATKEPFSSGIVSCSLFYQPVSCLLPVCRDNLFIMTYFP